jgi:hypothetical protein
MTHFNIVLPSPVKTATLLLPSGIRTKISYAFISSIHDTCSISHTHANFWTLTISDKEWTAWSSSMCSCIHPPVSYGFRNYSWKNSEWIFGPILFLNEEIIFENILNLCSEKRRAVNSMDDTCPLTISRNSNLLIAIKKILHVPNEAIPWLTPKKITYRGI